MSGGLTLTTRRSCCRYAARRYPLEAKTRTMFLPVIHHNSVVRDSTWTKVPGQLATHITSMSFKPSRGQTSVSRTGNRTRQHRHRRPFRGFVMRAARTLARAPLLLLQLAPALRRRRVIADAKQLACFRLTRLLLTCAKQPPTCTPGISTVAS